jgi:hypothetical protein
MGRYNYTKALDKLIEWAHGEGFNKITLNHDDISYIDWEKKSLNFPKLIKIEGKYTKEIQVYLMLHELGHHQLRKDWDNFGVILPISYHAENSKFFDKDKKLMRRNAYIVSSLEEEYLAWGEGKKLGLSMEIVINDDKWYEFRAKCLMAYIRHYANKKP